MEISLDDIDRLRARANITYRQAREMLEEAGGDLVEALIRLEESQGKVMHQISEQGRDFYRRALRVASDLHRTRVKVKVKEKTLFELPVSIGALGTVFFPKLAALGVIGLMVASGSLEVHGEPAAGGDRPEEGGSAAREH